MILSLLSISLTGCDMRKQRYVVGESGESVTVTKPQTFEVQGKDAAGKPITMTYEAKPGDHLTPADTRKKPIQAKAQTGTPIAPFRAADSLPDPTK